MRANDHNSTLVSLRETSKPARSRVSVECGWGRLLFAPTFAGSDDLIRALRNERPGRRDIAFYVHDPHVVLAQAPQEVFLDPSDTYRLWLRPFRHEEAPDTFEVRRLRTEEDAQAVDNLFETRKMVPMGEEFLLRTADSNVLVHHVAEDCRTGEIVGVITGVDHKLAIGGTNNGASMWNLAVDPRTPHPGVGEALVDSLAALFQARGRDFMDLSVLSENTQAIALYAKKGFRRLRLFSLKRKNPINEPLFIGPSGCDELNPYAAIIVDEARRRGVAVEVIDPEHGYFSLTFGGRSITCRESLSELTTAVAMSRCDDKEVTSGLLTSAGLRVPAQEVAGTRSECEAFLETHERVVVKPAKGEQGAGVHVDITDTAELHEAVERAGRFGEKVLLEEFVTGEDLRIVVVDHRVVAAAVRRPAQVAGTGTHTVRQLIEKQSRRRAAATGGESTIPVDTETERCVRAAGYGLDAILPANEHLVVRKTANLHSGGTIHDVTTELHPELIKAARKASFVLDIPVVGLDLLVEAVDRPEYVVVEANERPGLANHEPQPTAQRFVDLLFPQTVQGG